jgi:hypothetical protein
VRAEIIRTILGTLALGAFLWQSSFTGTGSLDTEARLALSVVLFLVGFFAGHHEAQQARP